MTTPPSAQPSLSGEDARLKLDDGVRRVMEMALHNPPHAAVHLCCCRECRAVRAAAADLVLAASRVPSLSTSGVAEPEPFAWYVADAKGVPYDPGQDECTVVTHLTHAAGRAEFLNEHLDYYMEEEDIANANALKARRPFLTVPLYLHPSRPAPSLEPTKPHELATQFAALHGINDPESDIYAFADFIATSSLEKPTAGSEATMRAGLRRMLETHFGVKPLKPGATDPIAGLLDSYAKQLCAGEVIPAPSPATEGR